MPRAGSGSDEENNVDVVAEEVEDLDVADAEGDDVNEEGDADEEKSDAPKKQQRGKPKSSRAKKAKAAKSAKKKVTIVRKAAPKETDDVKMATAKSSTVTAANDTYRSSTGVLISRPTARDVKIGNFSLMSYGRMLVQDTTIELTIGRRYGLIGPNGSGKSTFLQCLAHREVPIPDHIDIFYLDEEAAPSPLTALQYILADAEQRVKDLENQAERYTEEYGPDSDLVHDIFARLDEMNPETFATRVGTLLKGLGFDKAMMAKATKDMSGGWRMRVALAKALFYKPTLLLLDEPTNHLDLEACVWLENYLAKYDRCLIVVSHSQDFLNGVCTNIIHITPKQKLQVYGGNYNTFIQVKAENEVNQMKQYKKEQDDIKHLKAFIASCGTYSNLVRQAKSKQKIIDKMEAAGLTEPVMKEPSFNFRFPTCEPLPPPVLSFENVSFAYDGKLENALYQHVNVGITMDSRVALVGPNGAGKSTLLKLMVAEVTPTEGQIRRHLHLSMGRYHQHSADQLDSAQTPLEFVMSKYEEKKMGMEEWRQHLGKYGIRGKEQTTEMRKLSDGQKSRMVFALIALERPNLLLLDEPTNHLDIECIDSLAEAINAFQGGLVLVSHDFRLIDQVAKEILVCDNKSVTTWRGSIREYKESLVKRMQSEGMM